MASSSDITYVDGRRKVEFKARTWGFMEDELGCTIFHISGQTRSDTTIFVKVVGFQPNIIVAVPQFNNGDKIKWNKRMCDELFEHFTSGKSHIPISYKTMHKDNLYGKSPLLAMSLFFRSNAAAKGFAYNFRSRKSGMYVADAGMLFPSSFKFFDEMDPILKYSALTNLNLAGWIEVTETIPSDEETLTEEERKFGCTDITLTALWTDLKKVNVDASVIVQPTYLSFDIECNSRNHNSKLPDPSDPLNVIFQIGMVSGRLMSQTGKVIKLLTLFDPHPIDGVVIERFKSEKSLLLDGFVKAVNSLDNDTFIGYNIMKFDWDYMIKRAELGNYLPKFLRMSRLYGRSAEIKNVSWASSAYKNQEFRFPECHGRVNLDVIIEIERNFRLPTYSLNYVSGEFLNGEGKDDVTPIELFMCYKVTHEFLEVSKTFTKTTDMAKVFYPAIRAIMQKRKTHTEIRKLRRELLKATWRTATDSIRKLLTVTGKYCVQDTLLPVKLVEKMNMWTVMQEMSNTMSVPLSFLHTRGQQIKILSQIYRECIKDDIVIPMKEGNIKSTEKYQGAIVVKAVPGVYTLVGVLDFASLYPTTMIVFNIDYTTILRDDEEWPEHLTHTLEWEDHVGCEHDPKKRKKDAKDVLCRSRRYRFKKVEIVFHKDGSVEYRNEGLLPRLEKNLLTSRSKVKKEMLKCEARINMHTGKATEDDIEFYKKCGFEIIPQGHLSELEEINLRLTHSVHNAEQLAIKVSANCIPGFNAIPCLLGDNTVVYRQIEDLFNENCCEEDDDGNQVCQNNDVKVWSDAGWTDIKYIVRRPIHSPLTRVLTHTGCVDATQEHSLLYEDSSEVKTSDVRVGESLLHYPVPLPEDTPRAPRYLSISNEIALSYKCSTFEEKRAYVHGIFFAEGTCGYYESCDKSSWCIYNMDEILLTKARKYLNACTSSCTFKIYNHGSYETTRPGGMKGVYKILYLRPNGNVKDLVLEYREMFYTSRREKKVPDYILSAPRAVREAFFIGYYAGDGRRQDAKGIVITNKGHLGSAQLCYLAKTLGYKVSISISKHHDHQYRLQCCEKFRNVHTAAIKSLGQTPPIRPRDVVRPYIINGYEVKKDGADFIYKCVRIITKRRPTVLQIDCIEKHQRCGKYRGRITTFDSTKKKIEYTCDTCGFIGTVGAQLFSKSGSKNVCKCDESMRYVEDENLCPRYSQKRNVCVEYVYDIETVSHHFAAGVGDIIVHNSAYGGMGAQTGFIPFVAGAESVTAMGRQQITLTVDILEKQLGNVVVYGDTDSAMSQNGCDNPEDAINKTKADGKIITHYLKLWSLGKPYDHAVYLDGKRYEINRIKQGDEIYNRLSEEDRKLVLLYARLPLDLEFEKMYGVMMLLTMKRYFATIVNEKGDVVGFDKKGCVLSRRDNCGFLKKTYKKLADMIVMKNPGEVAFIKTPGAEREIMHVIYDRIHELFTRQIPDSDLVIYIGIGALLDYAKKTKVTNAKGDVIATPYIDKDEKPFDDVLGPLDPRLVYQNIPQCLLALKMTRRGVVLPSNIRLEFLYVETKHWVHQGDKAEDYAYYMENKSYLNLRPDLLHYIEKQFAKPIGELIDVLFPKEDVMYVKLETRFKELLNSDRFDESEDLRSLRSNIFRQKTKIVKERPYGTGDNTCVCGWDCAISESNTPVVRRYIASRIRSFRSDSIRGAFDKYTTSGILNVRAQYIINVLSHEEDLSDFEIELLETSRRWKNKNIIDRLHRQHGLQIRSARRSTQTGDGLIIGTKVMVYKPFSSFPKGKILRVVSREIVEEIGKRKIYAFGLIDPDTNRVVEGVSRNVIAPFYRRDGKILEDIVKFRTYYRQVVDDLNNVFERLTTPDVIMQD